MVEIACTRDHAIRLETHPEQPAGVAYSQEFK
jgi:hypothetical protein